MQTIFRFILFLFLFEMHLKASDTIQYIQLTSQKRDSIIRLMDSITHANSIENKLKKYENAFFEKPAIGPFDIDLQKIIHYNDYEGLCLGLGLYTNEKVAKNFSTGGYFTYGFHDKSWKYGANLDFFKTWNSFEKLTFSFRNDVSERGSIHFMNDRIFGSSDWLRKILILKMDPIKEYNVGFSYSPIRFLLTNIGYSNASKTVTNYYFAPTNTFEKFQFSEFNISFKYAYRENFKKNNRNRDVSIGSDYPMVWFNYIQNVTFFEGEHRFSKYEWKIRQEFRTQNIGKLHLIAISGISSGKTPICNLYNGNGSYRKFTFETENSFATMGVNEFYSSQFASFYAKHNFGTLLWQNIISSPEFSIVTNMGVGKMKHSEYHNITDYKTLEKGYYESGFLIENIFGTLGFGMYYRYGPYQFEKISSNVAYKLTFGIKQ